MKSKLASLNNRIKELTGDSEEMEKKIKGNSRKLHEFNLSEVGDILVQTHKSIRFFNWESKKLEKEETLIQSKFGVIFFPPN